MENKKAVLLLSGGIDSTTLLAQLTSEGYSILALSFDYGQKHRYELELAKKNAALYRVVEHKIVAIAPELFKSSALVNKDHQLSTYAEKIVPETQVNAYVPFRNLLFLSMALSLAESSKSRAVYGAFNKDDGLHYWDCSKQFISNVSAIARQNSDIEIVAPFLELTKKEIIELSISLKVDLTQTVSCYQPINDKECGSCFSCRSKKIALGKQ